MLHPADHGERFRGRRREPLFLQGCHEAGPRARTTGCPPALRARWWGTAKRCPVAFQVHEPVRPLCLNQSDQMPIISNEEGPDAHRDQHGLCTDTSSARGGPEVGGRAIPVLFSLAAGARDGFTKFSTQRPCARTCPSTPESRLEPLQYPAEKRPPPIGSHTCTASKPIASPHCLFYPALIFTKFFLILETQAERGCRGLFRTHPRDKVEELPSGPHALLV